MTSKEKAKKALAKYFTTPIEDVLDVMTFTQFCREVQRLGLTIAQVRYDVPPSDEVLDLYHRCPNYEAFAMRWCRGPGR